MFARGKADRKIYFETGWKETNEFKDGYKLAKILTTGALECKKLARDILIKQKTKILKNQSKRLLSI